MCTATWFATAEAGSNPVATDGQVDNKMWSMCTMQRCSVLCPLCKEGNSDPCYNVDEPGGNHTKWNNSHHKTNNAWLHLYGVLESFQIQRNTIVVAKGWEEQEMRICCLMRETAFFSWERWKSSEDGRTTSRVYLILTRALPLTSGETLTEPILPSGVLPHPCQAGCGGVGLGDGGGVPVRRAHTFANTSPGQWCTTLDHESVYIHPRPRAS